MSEQTEAKKTEAKNNFEMLDNLLVKGGEETADELVVLATESPAKFFSYIDIKGLEIESSLMKIRTASITLARALTVYLEKKDEI